MIITVRYGSFLCSDNNWWMCVWCVWVSECMILMQIAMKCQCHFNLYSVNQWTKWSGNKNTSADSNSKRQSQKLATGIKYNNGKSKYTQIINKNRLREKLLSLLFGRMRTGTRYIHNARTRMICAHAQSTTSQFKSHAQRPWSRSFISHARDNRTVALALALVTSNSNNLCSCCCCCKTAEKREKAHTQIQHSA